MRRVTFRQLFAFAVAVIVGLAVFYLLPEPLPELTRDEFMDEVRAGHVWRVEIEDQEVIIVDSSARGQFRTDFHATTDAQLPDELRARGIEVWFSKSPPGI